MYLGKSNKNDTTTNYTNLTKIKENLNLNKKKKLIN